MKIYTAMLRRQGGVRRWRKGYEGAISFLDYKVVGTSIGLACRRVLMMREDMIWLLTAIANHSNINTSNLCIAQGCPHCRPPGWDGSKRAAGEDSDDEGERGHKPQGSMLLPRGRSVDELRRTVPELAQSFRLV